MTKLTDTGILKAHFPGFAWLPRWCREHLGLPNVIATLLAIFSAGVWWDNHEKGRDLRDIKASLSQIDANALRKADIANMVLQVDEVWRWKKAIDQEAEVKLAPIEVSSPAPSAKRGAIQRQRKP